MVSNTDTSPNTASMHGMKGGITDAHRLLGNLVTPRDDASVITVECTPADYSASLIARSVEDVNVHLVDLISHPSEHEGTLLVTLRVRTLDPSPVMRSLERYGYTVLDAPRDDQRDALLLRERIAALNAFINV